MLRVFEHDLADPDRFVITLELVPGTESRGRLVDTVLTIATDAYEDGRVSAVSITDNPGGNPSLSPDVIGNEIFKIGMDTIVHMTSRDMNRTGLESIQGQWQDFIPEFDFPQSGGFYLYQPQDGTGLSSESLQPLTAGAPVGDRLLHRALKDAHQAFFNADSKLTPLLRWAAERLDFPEGDRFLTALMEDPPKRMLLDCQRCGDCAIEHVGFLCPESKCPKHMRNGPCGGSANGQCEVNPEKTCVWVRAYLRLANTGDQDQLTQGLIPPRMWELNRTSAWINFHLDRDHQSSTNEIALFCNAVSCRLPRPEDEPDGKK